MLRAFSRTVRGSSEMLLALDFRLGAPREIMLVAPREREQADPFLDVLRTHFLPRHVRVVAVEGEDLQRQSATVPLVAGKVARDGETTAYVCRQGVCKLPTRDVSVFRQQLERGGRGDGSDSE
jgi:uncharacterized protein YyaL (SSP411 family)